MKISRISAVVAALIAGAVASFGQLTAKQVFAEAPQSVFPLLDHDTKLDMIDYFESGMSTASKNAMEGKSRITAMSPEKLGIAMSEASEYELCLLPRVSGDTVVALISTVATPAPDSRMTVYTGDWGSNITSQVFSKPALSEWLTEEGQARAGEVEGLVPFLLVSYSYDPASATLTMKNNTGAFLSADVYELVSPCLKETVTYRWDGKKFVR